MTELVRLPPITPSGRRMYQAAETEAPATLDLSTVDASLQRLGDKIVEKVEAFAKQQAGRAPLPGGEPLAKLSDPEAEAFRIVRDHVDAYYADLQTFRSAGVSLTSYVRSRVRDELGVHMHPSLMSESEQAFYAALESALAKQDALLEEKYGVMR